MPTEPSDPHELLTILRASLAHLQHLTELHPDDPFYARSAEQVADIVAGLESRVLPAAGSGIPYTPSPG